MFLGFIGTAVTYSDSNPVPSAFVALSNCSHPPCSEKFTIGCNAIHEFRDFSLCNTSIMNERDTLESFTATFALAEELQVDVR